ncbi:fimbria/pilus periplasmic chaperone [Salmonella enterica]|nr:fimbria/pilus periplasmic chaperone [Salmonella enterica]
MKTISSFLLIVFFSVFFLLVFLFGTETQAANGDTKLNVKSYGLVISQNRVIFPKNASSVGITVKNPRDYPVLVHSRILAEDKKAKGGFMTTPPLFRLDPGRANVIKILPTGGDFPEDREQLQWLCVKGIPPKKDDEWARSPDGKKTGNERSMTLRLAVDNCIKLLVRPDGLSGTPVSNGDRLTWKVVGNDLVVVNPTPFYMNLSMIKLAGATVPADYVAPFAEKRFPLPKGKKGGLITWKILTDAGAESPAWSASLH